MKPSNFQFFTILFSGIVVLMIACSSLHSKHDFAFDRLVGCWKISDGTKTQIETWKATEDGFQGEGVVLSSNDTTFVESLSIFKKGEKWIYQAKASGQNDDKPVEFVQENQSGSIIAFANYTHDFPQRIVYELISDDELQAYIEGPRDGEKIRIVMDFKRVSVH
jgi:hypothetical protein